MVDKLAMMSIIIATVVIPAVAARERNGRRGARRMVFLLLLFDAAYVAYVTMIHARFYVPEYW